LQQLLLLLRWLLRCGTEQQLVCQQLAAAWCFSEQASVVELLLLQQQVLL
jgi:hypothetical protein